MPRYAALLRGVSPMNAKMPELARCFADAGFEDVKTVLASGNVLFGTKRTALPTLERRIETAMQKSLDRSFATIVRPVDDLAALLDEDPFRALRLRPQSKRVVTFLKTPTTKAPALPIEQDDASILALRGDHVLSAYVPGPKGPVFMVLLEKTFGKDITTRTWDTVKKLVAKG